MRNTLGKEERLKSIKVITALFENGQSLFSYPFKLVFQINSTVSETHFPLKFGISVPKRKFRSAVKRNRIKRLSREAYRLKKHGLFSLSKEKELQIDMMFIYIADKELTYQEIEKGMVKILGKMESAVRR